MNDTEKKVISQMLDEIILTVAPTATTVSKYGGVLYTVKSDEKEGQFCGIFHYKNHVQLTIVNDPVLKDPEGVLLGNGKTRRHINFNSPDKVNARVIAPLLSQVANT